MAPREKNMRLPVLQAKRRAINRRQARSIVRVSSGSELELHHAVTSARSHDSSLLKATQGQTRRQSRIGSDVPALFRDSATQRARERAVYLDSSPCSRAVLP